MLKLNTQLILFLMYVKKFTIFCQVLKKTHTKENWFLFLPHVIITLYMLTFWHSFCSVPLNGQNYSIKSLLIF